MARRAVAGTTIAALLAMAPLAAADGLPAGDADVPFETLAQTPVETIYGASKFVQKVTEAPASISIVTAEEIRAFGYRTLADVLRAVPGMYVTYDRKYENFGVRGFNRPGDFNTRTLLLVDGHRINDALYGSAAVGAELGLDLAMVERVEVIRGPGSSLYGSNAFFGVINIVTRKGGQLDGLEAEAATASFDSQRGRVAYGRKYASGLEMAGSATLSDSGGHRRLYFPEFDAPETNQGVAEDVDGEHWSNGYASAAYGAWSFMAHHGIRRKDVPTASFGTLFNDGRERITDERNNLEAQYRQALNADTGFAARLSFDRFAYRAAYPVNVAAPGDPPEVIVHYDDNHADSAALETQLTSVLSDRATLVAGLEYRDDVHLAQQHSLGERRAYVFRSLRDGQSLGAFAQSQYAVAEHLLLSGGLRLDHHDRFGEAWSPRLALVGFHGSTVAKLLYGQAFRAPNAYEQYLDIEGYIRSNPDLEPETIRTHEFVLEHLFAAGWQASLSAYQYDIDDLLQQVVVAGDTELQFRNIAHVRASGVEVEARGRLSGGLALRGSYALQSARDETRDALLDNSPRHLAKLNVMTPPLRLGITAGLEVQHVSPLRTLGGNTTDAFTVANMTLSSDRLFGDIRLSASAYNLFDERYAYPGSTANVQDAIAQDGRSFQVKATYGF